VRDGVVVGVVLRQYLMLTDNQLLNRRVEQPRPTSPKEEHFRAMVQNSSDVITLIGATVDSYQSASVEGSSVQGGRASRKPFGDWYTRGPHARTAEIDEAINIVGPPIATECRLRRVDESYC